MLQLQGKDQESSEQPEHTETGEEKKEEVILQNHSYTYLCGSDSMYGKRMSCRTTHDYLDRYSAHIMTKSFNDPLHEKKFWNKIFDSLSDDNNLALSKLKAFADNKLYVTQIIKFVFPRVETTVGKGENAGDQNFLRF